MRVAGFAVPSYAKLVAINSSGQSIPSGAFTTLTGWTTQIDTAGAFNPTTGIYTCPAAGIYDVSTQLLMNSAAAGPATNIFAAIKKNGAFVYSGEFPVPQQVGGVNAANTSTMALPFPVPCAKGDTIQIQVLQNAGVNLALFASPLFNELVIRQLP